MKHYHHLIGVVVIAAVMAMTFCPEAQARKKRDLKQEAIEDLLREGVNNYEAGNYEDAFDYFEAAHNKGNIRATHNLALCYAQGQGVEKSLTMAFKLYEKAAKKGYADSMVELGTMYKNAYGVKQNYKTAIKWFEKAAKQGNTDAMYLMGSCYYYGGYGIKKDLKKAREWIGKAAALGHETAISNLEKIQ